MKCAACKYSNDNFLKLSIDFFHSEPSYFCGVFLGNKNNELPTEIKLKDEGNGNSYKDVFIYACPSCGTLKIDNEELERAKKRNEDDI